MTIIFYDNIFRLDAPCPHNYNPADYFVQLLAVVPGREESCKQAISMICDNFEKCELGLKNFQAATAVVSKICLNSRVNTKIWIHTFTLF